MEALNLQQYYAMIWYLLQRMRKRRGTAVSPANPNDWGNLAAASESEDWGNLSAATDFDDWGMLVNNSILDNLAAHWKLEESSGIRYDSAGRHHHLSPYGAISQAGGKLGYAAQFVPYSEDYLGYPDTPDLRLAGTDFTITGWVMFNVVTEQMLVSKWETGSKEYFLGVSGGRVCCGLSWDGVNSTIVSVPNGLVGGVWYHFAAWYDAAAKQLSLALNNETPMVQSVAGVFNGSAALRLGKDAVSGNYLFGRLDSVSIWRRCLSAAERAQIYNGGAGLDYPFN